jgi:Mn2+/Fe2+ NRAMP family transporter
VRASPGRPPQSSDKTHLLGLSNLIALFIMLTTAATLNAHVGGALNFTPLDPIKALFWSAVINGVAAVAIMIMIMLMASREKVMGAFALRPVSRFGWLATAVMTAAAFGMFATWGD